MSGLGKMHHPKDLFCSYLHRNKQTTTTIKTTPPHQSNKQLSAHQKAATGTGAFLQSSCCWRGTFSKRAAANTLSKPQFASPPVWKSTSTCGDKGGLCTPVTNPKWYWDLLFSLYSTVSIEGLKSQKKIPASTSYFSVLPFTSARNLIISFLRSFWPWSFIFECSLPDQAVPYDSPRKSCSPQEIQVQQRTTKPPADKWLLGKNTNFGTFSHTPLVSPISRAPKHEHFI